MFYTEKIVNFLTSDFWLRLPSFLTNFNQELALIVLQIPWKSWNLHSNFSKIMQELNQAEDIKTTYRESKRTKRLFFFIERN